MNPKTKLELTWIGKNTRPRLEPRILLEDPALSYHAEHRVMDTDLFDSRVIFGDNLLALKALEQEFMGKIKCIYIDPPYNTGSAFEHYDDGIEHSLWLTMMRDRLSIIYDLLSTDGLIFVQIDYREGARLKVLMDEIFGTTCFKNEIIVRRGTKNVQSQFETIDALATGHDYVLLYSKDPAARLPKLQAIDDEEDPGKWDTFWRGTDRPTMRYELFSITPERGQWRWSEERGLRARLNYELYKSNFSHQMTLDQYYALQLQETGEKMNFVRLGPEGTVQYFVAPRNYRILSDVWMDLSTTGAITNFPHEKHEQLIERIIRWSTQPGDWVLDSFAGSGTTGAVAHKMGRRFVMIELGDHAHTHILPRLHKVIDGTDQGGISQAVGWKGGGGFRYYKLAPSLLQQDKWGQWIINKDYNPAMFAEAVCKHEDFVYAPSETEYWNHGHSSEQDFIFVTTQTLTQEQLAHLSAEVGDDRTLLICCAAFRGSATAWPNLTLRKIPLAIASRCEWGRDDYSLQIACLPPQPAETSAQAVHGSRGAQNGNGAAAVPTLFDSAELVADAEKGEDV